jgi:hypothetical protein
MKLSNLSHIFQKKPQVQEFYLSLLLSQDAVAGATWQIGEHGVPLIAAASGKDLPSDSWEERIKASDTVLTSVEQKSGATATINNVIFGLPAVYLTADGDILPDIRPFIKKLTRVLELAPLGFVALHQAIIHKMKHDEGVPPTVILVEVSSKAVTITVYKIGAMVGQETKPHQNNYVEVVEDILRGFKHLEVLPSRMLLVGTDKDRLEDVKRELLKYPWPNKVNFMHFPKIELLAEHAPILAVSFAGANELAHALGKDITEPETPTTLPDAGPDITPESYMAESALPVVTPTEPIPQAVETQDVGEDEERTLAEEVQKEELHGGPVGLTDQAKEALSEEEDEEEEEETESDEEMGDAEESQEDEDGELVESEEEEEEKPTVSVSIPAEDDVENVQMVDPGVLGFRKSAPVHSMPPSEIPHQARPVKSDVAAPLTQEADIQPSQKGKRTVPTLPKFKLPHIAIPSVRLAGIGIIAVVILLVFGAGFLGYWVLPRATVTVLAVPKTATQSLDITIDQTATSVDADKKIVPGKVLEKSVSGDRVAAATGKKQVGDPARGSVTIYNKSTVSRSFKKGAILTYGSLSFTLDSEVSVASASEDFNGKTYAKANVNVTASNIGANGNLPSGTEFDFKDISSDIAIARNDTALAGGTSRSILVVSRADQDALVKAITAELVTQATQDLSSGVGGNEKLIEDTVKTAVKDKKFLEEIDQEASQVHGTVTLSVSGIAYSQDDIVSLGKTIVTAGLPAGYTLIDGRTTSTLSNVKVKKDGSITATAAVSGVGQPTLNVDGIKKAIVGKTITQAQEYLKSVSGVGGAEFSFSLSLGKNKLPVNKNNITVKVSLQ